MTERTTPAGPRSLAPLGRDERVPARDVLLPGESASWISIHRTRSGAACRIRRSRDPARAHRHHRRHLDHHVGRLHDAHHLRAGLQVELLDRLRGHQAHQPVGASLDLDHGGDAIGLDAGHDAREAVAGALGHDGSIGTRPAALGEQPIDLLAGDGALAATRALRRDAPILDPPAERVGTDVERLGGVADPELDA